MTRSTTDKVFADVIAGLTGGCEREDCRVQYLGGMTTLIGWTPTYDKHGNRVDADPNTVTNSYRCSTCGKQWTVKQ